MQGKGNDIIGNAIAPINNMLNNAMTRKLKWGSGSDKAFSVICDAHSTPNIREIKKYLFCVKISSAIASG
jgi:hypothetical protein